MSGDQRRELRVLSLSQVDEGERVGIDRQRSRWHIGRLHLAEVGEGGHERVPLLVACPGVHERLGINRSATALTRCELVERVCVPELSRVDTEYQLLAAVDRAKRYRTRGVCLRVERDLAAQRGRLPERGLDFVVEVLRERDLDGRLGCCPQTSRALLEIGLDQHADYGVVADWGVGERPHVLAEPLARAAVY